MKLLEAVKLATIDNKDMLLRIYYALEDRKDVLECQEPFGSSDFFYEKWEEKFEEFNSIFESFESIIEELCLLEDNEDERRVLSEDDLVRLKDELDKISLNLTMYQIEYGGLKRLTI